MSQVIKNITANKMLVCTGSMIYSGFFKEIPAISSTTLFHTGTGMSDSSFNKTISVCQTVPLTKQTISVCQTVRLTKQTIYQLIKQSRARNEKLL